MRCLGQNGINAHEIDRHGDQHVLQMRFDDVILVPSNDSSIDPVERGGSQGPLAHQRSSNIPQRFAYSTNSGEAQTCFLLSLIAKEKAGVNCQDVLRGFPYKGEQGLDKRNPLVPFRVPNEMRNDATTTLAVFSGTLCQEVDLNQLRKNLLTVVQETMQPAHVSIWLRPPERISDKRAVWKTNPPASAQQERGEDHFPAGLTKRKDRAATFT